MKKIVLILGLGILVISCEDKNQLDILIEQKAEIESVLNKKTTQLNEINEEISKLQTDSIDYADVTAVTSQKEVFEHYISIQGKVEADQMVMIVPEVGGLITSLPAKNKEGKIIQKGELIATFNSDMVSSSMNELAEQIKVADFMVAKQQKLYDQGLGNIIQLEQAKGQLNTLKKTKQSLLTQKGKFKLVAPFTGIIEKVYAVKGQMSGPATPILMLVGINKRKVVANISESYLKNISLNALVDIDFPALDLGEDNLRVTRVGSFVDPINRTILMEVDLLESNDKYVPNLMANVKIRDIVDSAAVLIPSKVILKGANQASYVFVLNKTTDENGKALFEVVKKDIEIGAMYNGKTVVTQGLKGGELIVNRGRADVYVGNLVEVVKG